MISLVLITGLSGAGRSQAGNVFEDMGWFVIDNLPTELLDKVVELVQGKRPHPDHPSVNDKVALVVRAAGPDLAAVLATIRPKLDDVRVLYLDASDDVLVRRYEASRRPHP